MSHVTHGQSEGDLVKMTLCDPYLASNRENLEAEEEDYLHEPAQTRTDLKQIYKSYKEDNVELQALSKKDVVDRIVDGDWRRGLSHEQFAQIDFAVLEEKDTSMRWSALKLVPLIDDNDNGSTKRRKVSHDRSTSIQPRYPDMNAAIFVQNLKQHIAPLVKACYHIHRIPSLNLSIVRLYVSPNAPFRPLSINVPRNQKHPTDLARTMYIALPDSCPYVYVSISASTAPRLKDKHEKAPIKVDILATKRIVLEAIPKALSRPQRRWSLETTKLTAKSLRAMTLLRGSGLVGSCGGPLSQFTQPEACSQGNSKILPTFEEGGTMQSTDQQQAERDRNVDRRFGHTEGPNHAKLDKLQLRIIDLSASHRGKTKKRKMCSDEVADTERAPLTITFTGSDVFAGLKEFAMKYPDFVDMDKLPGVMTGETATAMAAI
ncbi:chromosome loss- protein [Lithohypha guttulata]|uniref:Chromosome loss- protein n=1 Tax=Lithohypha guttulata TaxID=1690604 RepID=A0AAN7T1G7_9EURO|nr:chromosome loss- protein [Lithohypha guttulata]